MREVIFRGKRTDNGEWVEGDLIQGIYMDKSGRAILPIDSIGFMEYEVVHPETVGQFTGLLDKNGKKIFDGDVVKVWHERDDDDSFWTTGVVEYSPAEFYIRGDGHSITCHFHYNASDRIVIGNIHDNPELINQ